MPEAETAKDTRSPGAIRAAERRERLKAERIAAEQKSQELAGVSAAATDTAVAEALEEVSATDAVITHDRELLAATDVAYVAAIEALATAADLIDKAGALHRASKLAVRNSMRSGGGLQFATDLPDDLGRRAHKDPEVSAIVQRFRTANANW